MNKLKSKQLLIDKINQYTLTGDYDIARSLASNRDFFTSKEIVDQYNKIDQWQDIDVSYMDPEEIF